MANGTEIGSAWVSILPDMRQVVGGVTKGMKTASESAAKAFTSGMGKNLGGVSKAFSEAGKSAGEALAKSALSAAKSDINKLSKQVSSATDAQSDALGRLRVAQAKLTEVQNNAKATASQLATAEERVESAQRKANVATGAADGLTKKLADAQGRAKTAAEDLAKAQSSAGEAAKKSGSKVGAAFTGAFRGGFNAKKVVDDDFEKVDGKKAGRGVATRFGVGFNGIIGGIISHSAGLFAAGFAAVQSVRIFGGFIADAKESQRVGKLTESVIKSTGGAAKISAAGVGALATAISNKTGMDDEAVQSGANLLLTFKNIRNEVGKGNDIFNQATAAAADLSAAGFGDLNTTSKQLGKALNDPIKGIAALNKSGVTFTENQKKQIKTLVESGNVLGAQKVILKEIGAQVGGAAAATASPLDRLKTIAGNLGEQFGGFLLPKVERFATFLGERVAPAISGLADLIFKGDFTGQLGKAFGIEEDSGIISGFFTVRETVVEVFGDIRAKIGQFAGFVSANVLPRLKEFAGFFKDEIVPKIQQFAGFVASNAVPAVKNLITAFTPLAKDIGKAAVAVFEKFGPAILGLVAPVLALLPAFKSFTGFLKDNQALVGAVAVGIGAMVLAFKAYRLAMLVSAAVGKAFAAVQLVINAVLSANPIGLIVLALIGLVAGLIYAYKHSETFRNIVNGVFNGVKGVVLGVVHALVTAFHAVGDAIGFVIGFVKDHWKTILPLILGPIIGIPLFIALHWAKIKEIFMTGVAAVLGALKTAWGAIVSVFAGPVSAVVGVLSAIWSRIYPILVLPFYIARTVINGIVGLILKGLTAAKDWVVGVFAKAWAAVSGVLAGPIRIAKTAIGTAWAGITAAFTAAKNWVVGAFAKVWAAVKATILGPVNLAKSALDTAWTNIKGAFTAVKDWAVGTFSKNWAALKDKLTKPVNDAKAAIGTALGAAKGGLQWVFKQAVSAIGKIWDGLQALAKAPIKFIVNTVLNDGLIGAFNWVADKFKAPTIPTIPLPKGFASGGEFSGRLPGPPSAVDNMLGSHAGRAVGLASGEFITNAKDTQRALPLLKHINAGGSLPGFADGGLFGKLKGVATGAFNAGKSFGEDVYGVLKDPVKWFKDRLAGPLDRMSELGNSPVAEVVKQVPRNLVDTVAGKAKELLGIGGGGFNANLGGVLDFVRAHVGNPYVWGGVGPNGFDCSGLVSAAINVAMGRKPFSRIGATGSMPWSMFESGPGAFEVGWFQGNPGHTAATVNGTNIESSGGQGVHMGPGARGAHDKLFTNRAHVKGFANGGLLGDPPFDLLSPRGKAYVGKNVMPSIPVFDAGGTLGPGINVVNNATGRSESLTRTDQEMDLSEKTIQAFAAALDGMRVEIGPDGAAILTAAMARTADSRIAESNRNIKRRVGTGRTS